MVKKIVMLSILLLLGVGSFSTFAKLFDSDKTLSSSSQKPAVTKKAETPIDINKADLGALATLKGVGEKKAKAIVTYREKHGSFKSLQALGEVPGFGEKSVARVIKKNANLVAS